MWKWWFFWYKYQYITYWLVFLGKEQQRQKLKTMIRPNEYVLNRCEADAKRDKFNHIQVGKFIKVYFQVISGRVLYLTQNNLTFDTLKTKDYKRRGYASSFFSKQVTRTPWTYLQVYTCTKIIKSGVLFN